MTIWSFRRGCAAALFLALAGCEGGTGIPLLDRVNDTASVPLSQAKMANGAMTLVPPQGFCIDKATLRQRFALLARCDTIGAPSAGAGAPVGLLTVSVSSRKSASLPTPQETADAAKLARVSKEIVSDGTQTYLAEGVPPSEGLDVVHWRGIARIGGEIVGVSLYGPKGGRATSSEGREIVESLIERSAAAS